MSQQPIFGLSAALVSPFAADGSPDLPRLARHATWVLGHGCDSLTLFGTTGEGFSIGLRDRGEMVRAVAEAGIDFGRVYGAVAAPRYPMPRIRRASSSTPGAGGSSSRRPST